MHLYVTMMQTIFLESKLWASLFGKILIKEQNYKITKKWNIRCLSDTENYKHIPIYIKSVKTQFNKYSIKINPLQRTGNCASLSIIWMYLIYSLRFKREDVLAFFWYYISRHLLVCRLEAKWVDLHTKRHLYTYVLKKAKTSCILERREQMIIWIHGDKQYGSEGVAISVAFMLISLI
jgi:hypothetical protein